jgi:hypothetical protein
MPDLFNAAPGNDNIIISAAGVDLDIAGAGGIIKEPLRSMIS